MAQWRNGAIPERRNGLRAQWRNGAVAQWLKGSMAQWRNGAQRIKKSLREELAIRDYGIGAYVLILQYRAKLLKNCVKWEIFKNFRFGSFQKSLL